MIYYQARKEKAGGRRIQALWFSDDKRWWQQAREIYTAGMNR